MARVEVRPRARFLRAALGAGAALLASFALLEQAKPAGAQTAPDSADRLIFWVDCEDNVVGLTDAELNAWKTRGVDGFVCVIQRLRGLGGGQDWTGNPNAALNTPNYALQRKLRDSRVIARARARGMKVYLGFFVSNPANTATPLKPWFDDTGWAQTVIPKVRDLAAAAKLLGAAGLAVDQELYAQKDGVRTATWNWNYPGNTRTEQAVRAKVTERGAQVMKAILGGFPGADIAVYHWYWPESWRELVQRELYGRQNAFAANANWNFWDGMTSVSGYSAIRLFDSTFYKTPHRGTWDNAMQYGVNSTLAFMSRRFRNWDYASSRTSVSPFSWIDPGASSSTWDDARPPEYVRQQLLAMRKWGMGGEFANYAFRSLKGFNYTPYVSAMQAASTPATVDGVRPTLSVTGSAPATGVRGTSRDNLGIRAIRWRDSRGRSGAAQMTWRILGGDYKTSYAWETQWSIPPAAVTVGATSVTVTAEDIKGRASAPVTVPWPPG